MRAIPQQWDTREIKRSFYLQSATGRELLVYGQQYEGNDSKCY